MPDFKKLAETLLHAAQSLRSAAACEEEGEEVTRCVGCGHRFQTTGSYCSLSPAPPAAPEERCVYGCACVYPNRRGCDCDCHPAAASAAPSGREERNRCGTEEAVSAPSPEQAQETWPCQCKCGCKITRTKAEGGSTFTVCDACWNGHAPPEQARRTWEVHVDPNPYAEALWFHDPKQKRCAAGQAITVVHLRPGERIVSGEGVRVHRYDYPGKQPEFSVWPCGMEPCNVPLREHGTYYPDAPPRAEEDILIGKPATGQVLPPARARGKK